MLTPAASLISRRPVARLRSPNTWQGEKAAIPRLEDVPGQPCRWNRLDRSVCRFDHLIPTAIRLIDSAAWPTSNPVVGDDGAPDGGMDCSATYRGLRLVPAPHQISLSKSPMGQCIDRFAPEGQSDRIYGRDRTRPCASGPRAAPTLTARLARPSRRHRAPIDRFLKARRQTPNRPALF
jgi:hypothetical protein